MARWPATQDDARGAAALALPFEGNGRSSLILVENAAQLETAREPHPAC